MLPDQRAPVKPATASRRPIGVLALLLGVYSLVLGIWYRSKFVRREVGGKAHVLSGYCFVEVFADIVIIFIVWANNEKITKGILPKTLLVYFVCMGASFYSLLPCSFDRLFETKVPLWQALRLFGNVIQLLLIRGLVKQLWTEEPAVPIPTVASNVQADLVSSDAVNVDNGGEESDDPLAALGDSYHSPDVVQRPPSPAPIHRSIPSGERSEPSEIILSVTHLMGRK